MSDLSLDYSKELIGLPAYADLRIENGDLLMTSDVAPAGTDATIQFCLQRLRLFLGEAFLNLEDGVPWYQQILVKNADKATVDGLLRDTILGTPGVTGLLAFNSTQNRSKRMMTVSFTVLTAQGNKVSAEIPITGTGGA